MAPHQDIIDGMPSVTVVIGTVFKHWFNFDNVSETVLEAAQKRGVDVHSACAAVAQGLYPVVDDEFRGYLVSFSRWSDLMVGSVILCETRLVDRDLGYHGTPDLLIQSKQGEIILVDLKTPQSLYKTWAWQLAAYEHLIQKCVGVKIDRSGSLRLSPDGKPARMKYYDGGDGGRALSVFLSALNVYRNAA